MRWSVAAIGLAIVLSAGCSGGDGQSSPSPTPSAPTTRSPDEPEAERPAWDIGQGWAYTVEIPGQPSDTFTMMVAEDRGDLWVVASDDRQKAVHHAVYSTNPVLGRISKETLSPYQDGEPAAMYRFPLMDGKTWSARLFGDEMSFRVTFEAIDVDDSLGLGNQVEGYSIVAEGPSGRHVAYDYVEGVEWFTAFEVRSPSGEREIRLTLVDVIDSYSGPYHFYRGADALVATHTHSANQVQTMPTDAAPVPEDRSNRVAIGVVFEGRTGTPGSYAQLTLRDPSGDTAWQREFTGATQSTALVDVAGTEGEWGVDYVLRGNLDLEVRVVGFTLFAEGTL